MQEIRVLLADDYEPFRRCVSSLFLKHPEWKIIVEVSDGLEAVKKTQELHPDVVLLDLSLPKIDGVEAANHNGGLPQLQKSSSSRHITIQN